MDGKGTEVGEDQMNKEEQERTRNKYPNEPQGVDLRIRPGAALGSRIPAAKTGVSTRIKKSTQRSPRKSKLRLRPGAALGARVSSSQNWRWAQEEEKVPKDPSAAPGRMRKSIPRGLFGHLVLVLLCSSLFIWSSSYFWSLSIHSCSPSPLPLLPFSCLLPPLLPLSSVST